MLFLAERSDARAHPNRFILQCLQGELGHPIRCPAPLVEGGHHFILDGQVLPSLQPVVLVFQAVEAALEVVALLIDGLKVVVDGYGVGEHEDGGWGEDLLGEVVGGDDIGGDGDGAGGRLVRHGGRW